MTNKRPTEVLLLTIALGLVLAVGYLRALEYALTGNSSLFMDTWVYGGAAIRVLDTILLYHFFMRHAAARLWVHIAFGAGTVLLFLTYTLARFWGNATWQSFSTSILVGLLINLGAWWLVDRYLTRRTIDGQPVIP